MKKFLSILLALCLMVSCAAFAESNTVEYDYDEDGVVDLIRYFDEDDETIWRTDYFTDGQLSSYDVYENLDEEAEGFDRIRVINFYEPDDSLVNYQIDFERKIKDKFYMTVYSIGYYDDGTMAGSRYSVLGEEGFPMFSLEFDEEGNLWGYNDAEAGEFIPEIDLDNLPFDLAEVVFPEIEFTLD